MTKGKNTDLIKNEALRLGFDFCGIAKADFMNEDARRLEKWLAQNYNGKMGYMANHFDMRVDPRKLVPDAKSVITLMLNYYPEVSLNGSNYKIARYAYGEDYHELIRSKLNLLLEFIRDQIGDVQGRGFVDSAPVLERSWAMRSGLGWIGKNGNLIAKGAGSYYFLATLIVDLELEFDNSFNVDHCGSCTKCLDACPTEAILPERVINGSKCISYYTIELKGEFDTSIPRLDNWVFGCDICQEVCPWNRFSKPHSIPEFNPSEDFINASKSNWIEVTEKTFNVIFGKSAVKRTKFKHFLRNIKWQNHLV